MASPRAVLPTLAILASRSLANTGGAPRPALPDEPTGQGQAAQDFQEDVLSPALGLRLFRGVRTVLTGELPRNHDAHRVGIRQVHVDETAPGCCLRWC